MKLLASTTSPFVRKVMVLAHERGIVDQLEFVQTKANPINRDQSVVTHNPSGKIPALVLDNGRVLYDSRVISAYLDTQHKGALMYPKEGHEQWEVMVMEALADGLVEAALQIRFENFLRPESLRWDSWVAGQMEKIDSSIDEMESKIDEKDDSINAGLIAIACALSYVDFRLAEKDWRSAHPKLAQWFENFSARPSMQKTALH